MSEPTDGRRPLADLIKEKLVEGVFFSVLGFYFAPFLILAAQVHFLSQRRRVAELGAVRRNLSGIASSIHSMAHISTGLVRPAQDRRVDIIGKPHRA